MSDLRVGEILHGVKATDWNCCRVEYVAHDWAVARTLRGTPIFVPDYDRNEVGEGWHDYDRRCPFEGATMAEPGHWEGVDDYIAVAALYGVGIELAPRIVDALGRAGLLVSSRYYVPSPHELYNLYASIGMQLRQGMKGLRWVMCRESYDAILRRERDRRVAAVADIRASWRHIVDDPLPDNDWPDSVPVADVDFRTQTAFLFGIPVRIDPAARSPLIEIDAEATTRGSDRAGT